MAKIKVKLEVFNSTPKPPTEKIVRLALEQSGEIVTLHVVNDRGDHVFGGNILQIHPEWGLQLIGSISEELNLPVDRDGRIKLY